MLSDRQTHHYNANFKEREVTELERCIIYVFADWCTYSADTFNFDKAGGLHALLCNRE